MRGVPTNPTRMRLRAAILRVPRAPRALETWAAAALAWRVTVSREELWPGMNDPFNGQALRLKTVRALVAEFEPGGFVETGTFIGSTTRFFAGNGIPVFTCEMKRAFWLIARMRLGWRTDVAVLRCDSRTMLESLTRRRALRRPLVYLDAHWWGDFPLADELELILNAWDDVVVLIDDFRVPGDDGYAYDVYDGKALAMEAITLPPAAAAAVPAQSSDLETGARRGTLYVAQGTNARRGLDHAAERGLVRIVAVSRSTPKS